MMYHNWDQVFNEVIGTDFFNNIDSKLNLLYSQKTIYPPKDQIYNCFKLTPLNEVKVVILGQDPYHGPNQAHGLAFSVKCAKLPPSLKNIYKELYDDLKIEISNKGDLTKWAKNGVLLLNTTLTVEAGRPLSHKNLGWEYFTQKIIETLNSLDSPICFILWGNHAKGYKKYLDNPNHLIIESNHPSPLSAYQGFFKSKPFSRANQFLSKNGSTTIDWDLNN